MENGRKRGRTVILAPMDEECEYLVGLMKDRREERIGGYIFYEGEIDGVPLAVVQCLIGTVNAAVCTTLAIERYSPKCVIIEGTSGAHVDDLCKNDIVIAERIVALTHVRTPERARGEGTDPLEWEEFGIKAYTAKDDSIGFIGEYHSDERLVSLAKTVRNDGGRVFVGTVGCGDVWNREADLIDFYHRTKGTLCEAMEGFAVAEVCATFGVPMIEIRVISNNELHAGEYFTTDTALYSQKFVEKLIKMI